MYQRPQLSRPFHSASRLLGSARTYNIEIEEIPTVFRIKSRTYPGPKELKPKRWWRRWGKNGASGSRVVSNSVDFTKLPKIGTTDHVLELILHKIFIMHAWSGILPSGSPAKTLGIKNLDFWNSYLNPSLPENLSPVTPGGPLLRRPVDRVFEAIGSKTNPGNLELTEDEINHTKGSLFMLQVPIGDESFKQLVVDGSKGDEQCIQKFLQHIQSPLAIFDYLRAPKVAKKLRNSKVLWREQSRIIEDKLPGGEGLTALWGEILPDYERKVCSFSQKWVRDRIQEVRSIYHQRQEALRKKLSELDKQIQSELDKQRLRKLEKQRQSVSDQQRVFHEQWQHVLSILEAEQENLSRMRLPSFK